MDIFLLSSNFHDALPSSQLASVLGTEEFLQFWHDDVCDEPGLVGGEGVPLGVLHVMLDAGLVGEERVVQYHEIVIHHAEDVALEIRVI